MHQGHENETGDTRYAFLYDGVVTDRKDPMKLGRVKVRVPGLLDPDSPWCFPAGMPGAGGHQRGMKWVPPVGAEVVIFFRGGDPNQPRYMTGHYGMPGNVPEVPADANVDGGEDVHCFEWNRFAITVDERVSGKETLQIKDKVSGDMIEFDASAPGLHVKATAGIVFEVDGVFAVKASTVILNGRKLGEGSKQF